MLSGAAQPRGRRMFRELLVPIDLSEPQAATRAIAMAANLAARWDAGLTFLSIVAPPAEDEAGAEHSARAAAALAALIGDRVPHRRPCLLVKVGGSVSGRIMEAVEERGIDLVVMASHNPEVTDYLIGSNAAHVAVHAPCSVLIVRGREGPRFRSVLVPVNPELPDTASRALAVAEDIARSHGAELSAVAVQPLVIGETGSSPPDVRPRLEAFLAERMGGQCPELVVRLGGSVSGEIRDVAEEIGADLIVMGSRGPHFTESLIGSNAAHVALHAAVSVMVVR